MGPEDPDELLGRLKLGREEYVQRLITMLILDAPYPRWNTVHKPSKQGLEFLNLIEDLSFGSSGPWSDPDFIDEFDLPRRHDARKDRRPIGASATRIAFG